MTALTDYARLEAAGLWRAGDDTQRRDVFVSVGEASLTIYDTRDTPLAHWSLAALDRRNPGRVPARYAPGPDTDEELEIADEIMIDGIERVRHAVDRRRPRRGRLRLGLMGAGLAVVLTLAVVWLPDALIRHAGSVVPPAARTAIGARLLSEIERVSGAACVSAGGQEALDRLSTRLFGPGGARLVVVPDGIEVTEHLPGPTILLNRALVEDYESAEPAAGFILAEALRARGEDPLLRFLRDAGPLPAFRLLTTGKLPDETYRAHAEALVTAPPPPVADAALLTQFRAAEVSSRAYARALDISGETVLPLIEGDPWPGGSPDPVLADGLWLRLQAICGE